METPGIPITDTPRVEDHINLHFTDSVFHPAIPGIWTDEYAQQVARYALANAKAMDGSDVKRGVAQLVLSPDWTESMDMTILSDLHLAEASARGVSPWTLQEVLFMQENLYRSGMIPPDNLVEQRDEIFDLLGEVGADGGNYEDIGKRVRGLSLCITTVWPLRQVSEEKARQLQQLVTERVGSKDYEARVQFDMGQRRHDGEMIQKATDGNRDSYNEAARLIADFASGLTRDELAGYGRAMLKANTQVLKQNLNEQLGEVRTRATEFWNTAKKNLPGKKEGKDGNG